MRPAMSQTAPSRQRPRLTSRLVGRANADHRVCNRLVSADGADAFCHACRLNLTIPSLDDAGNLLLWQRTEAAKPRIVYGVSRFGLPLSSKFEDAERGLAFDFLACAGYGLQEEPHVFTDHAHGLITIDIAEADDAKREGQRRDMAELYRTVLGLFRSEVGHYYWERLIRNGVWHEDFWETFGDERRNYSVALAAHYANGPLRDWRGHYVSSYSGSHPWEDFAETWAHYLHIVDTLEIAVAFGLHVRPRIGRHPVIEMDVDFDLYERRDFNALIAGWLPSTYAVNSLNPSMGQPDLYPFVLTPTVMGKLRFVHGLIHGDGASQELS